MSEIIDIDDLIKQIAIFEKSYPKAGRYAEAALAAETIKALEYLQEQIAEFEEYILPCDVKVYPATTILKGCKLKTVINSIKQRESWELDSNNPDIEKLTNY